MPSEQGPAEACAFCPQAGAGGACAGCSDRDHGVVQPTLTTAATQASLCQRQGRSCMPTTPMLALHTATTSQFRRLPLAVGHRPGLLTKESRCLLGRPGQQAQLHCVRGVVGSPKVAHSSRALALARLTLDRAGRTSIRDFQRAASACSRTTRSICRERLTSMAWPESSVSKRCAKTIDRAAVKSRIATNTRRSIAR